LISRAAVRKYRIGGAKQITKRKGPTVASAAEQMAANLSWGALGKATDLRQRILFTVLVLIVYRLGTYIPVPGIDGTALKNFMDGQGQGLGGMLSLFTGGALHRMGIFALGVMPYISASIIIQLLASMVPQLEQLKKEGDQGRKKINQYTRYGTVALAIFQGWAIAASIAAGGLAHNPDLFFKISCVITLVGGTMFSPDKAVRDIDWTPMFGIESGYRDSYEWFAAGGRDQYQYDFTNDDEILAQLL
jgi:preprotein translocase subunit SecY